MIRPTRRRLPGNANRRADHAWDLAAQLQGLLLATGDTLYAAAPGVAARLPKDADGKVLGLLGGKPAWITATGANYSDAEAPVLTGGVTLTLAHTPNPAASLMLFRGNAAGAMALERNYTLAGNVITLVVAQVDANESFLVWYRY